jgi:hypothetical protein
MTKVTWVEEQFIFASISGKTEGISLQIHM